MKKVIVGLIGLIIMAGMALADTYIWESATITNGVTQTNNVTVSGWLEKIEYSQSAAASSTVFVATYTTNSAGTNVAVETYLSLVTSTADSTVVRPRFLPTDNTGASLSATVAEYWGGTNINGGPLTNHVATTALNVDYSRAFIGGNVKIMCSGAGGASSKTQSSKIVIFYEPIKH